jgi:hypothetical protein
MTELTEEEMFEIIEAYGLMMYARGQLNQDIMKFEDFAKVYMKGGKQ